MTSASPPAFRQNNVTLGASLSLVRGLYLISMTHYDVLPLLFKLLNLILYQKTLNSHLCYFLLNIVIFICFSTTYFFDNITSLCINLPNLRSSNMPHLVYITLFGETDGVTLSRLDCSTFILSLYVQKACVLCMMYKQKKLKHMMELQNS